MINRETVNKVKNSLLIVLALYLLFPAFMGICIAFVVGYFFTNTLAVGFTFLSYYGVLIVVMIGFRTGYPFLSFFVTLSFGITLIFFPLSDTSVEIMEMVEGTRSNTQ